MSDGLNISIFSKALYSSWCYLPSHKLVFDCGEGCATNIGNKLADIETLWITHSHGDHVLGLPSFIGCRNAGQGISRNADTQDHNKPLKIYYPADNTAMEDMIKFLEARYLGWLRYDLQFVPIEAGFELDLGNKHFVRAFDMQHQKGKTTLGYVIHEQRTHLKPEFKGQNIAALLKSGTVNRDQINETYRANLFAYCLDAYKIDDCTQLTDCAAAVMDCTFIKAEDRTDTTHFTLDEARKVCQGNGVKRMFAAHMSGRYDYNEVAKDYPDVHFINPFKVNHLV